MSRNVLVVLLLATGVARADDPPEAERVAPTAEAQAATKEGAGVAPAADTPVAESVAPASDAQAKAEADAKALSGMSVLGNQEAPKSLVIVPWKTSEIGGSLSISTLLDDSRQPIDKEVFMRALSYYEIRSK